MPSPVQITCSQLFRLVGTPAAPVLLDVRIDEDFAADPFLLPAAIRHPFDSIEALAGQLQSSRVVVYCQKGLKISEGAAAVLRCRGINAEVLEGGQFAWRDAALPMVPASSLPETHSSGQSVWVTRLRPKVDRIACPWLIRRFVDPNARFLFVSAPTVAAVAEKFNATPFDIDNVFWSHRGDQCTFDTMVTEFGLSTVALERLALIVRGADTDQHSLAPESAGLLAACLGLSRMYTDDLQQLDAGIAVFDAFYRWARDAVDEKHNWPSATKRSKDQ
ncbi:sulfurtransferase [Chromatiales bacterium (ex Bugula neritina AB1)]|nr:sulfurtransferase [Chromatiales bacterium (ex Bugula neritina AB1)]